MPIASFESAQVNSGTLNEIFEQDPNKIKLIEREKDLTGYSSGHIAENEMTLQTMITSLLKVTSTVNREINLKKSTNVIYVDKFNLCRGSKTSK